MKLQLCVSRPGVYAIEGCRVTAGYGRAAATGTAAAGAPGGVAYGQAAVAGAAPGTQQVQAAAAALAVADRLLLKVEPA